MVGIDPGHVLEGARMKAKDINSDFSLQQPRQGIVPKSLMNLGYKNLTVFDDRPLAEKMQGVKDMRDIHASGGDKAIFDD